MNDVIMAYEPKEKRKQIIEENETSSPGGASEETAAQTNKDEYRMTNGSVQ